MSDNKSSLSYLHAYEYLKKHEKPSYKQYNHEKYLKDPLHIKARAYVYRLNNGKIKKPSLDKMNEYKISKIQNEYITSL